MLMASFALGLVLLTMFFDGALEQRDNPNQVLQSQHNSDGSVSIDLQRNRQGHYVLRGLVNGHEVDFLLDTGATDVVIPESLAEEIGLEKLGRGAANTANGTITIYRSRIDTLDIGDIHLRDVSASINPSMGPGTALLGMSALRKVEFSQSGNRLTLRQLP